MPLKLRIFIASSSKGKRYANAIQDNLQPAVECVVWDQGEFKFTSSTLENLIAGIEGYDAAIFVLAPDDKLTPSDKNEKIGTSKTASRDNVVFELGLFIGRLGRIRTFIVLPEQMAELQLPTDLLGTVVGSFDASRGDSNWKASLAPVCAAIQEQVGRLGPLRTRLLADQKGSLVRYAAAVCYRLRSGIAELLLVNTTLNRRIFPKGIIEDSQTAQEAAVDYAAAEGGVFGRAAKVEPLIFTYFKAEPAKEQAVAACLIQAIQLPGLAECDPSDLDGHTTAKFRDPRWFSLEEAARHLNYGRSIKYQKEFERVVRWADAHIKQLSRPKIQAGAIPFRRLGSATQVLVVLSRTRQLWIFPKGNVEIGISSRECAKYEALEEAGAIGVLSDKPFGHYHHTKDGVEYSTEFFALEVEMLHDHWPEQDRRRREWVTVEYAATIVGYEHLKQALVDFRGSYMPGLLSNNI
jgi:8-oxo-dGTP pyrophosphatase MutT (NUDIX family)